MERTTWTDQRLDDLADGMRTGFARVDQDLRDLRSEVQSGHQGLRTEIGDLRTEMRDEFRSLRLTLFGVGGGIIVSLIGVIGAILARGG